MGKKKSRAALYAKLLEQPSDEGFSNDEAIARALISKAAKGDTAAAKYIAETLKAEEGNEACELTLKVVR